MGPNIRIKTEEEMLAHVFQTGEQVLALAAEIKKKNNSLISIPVLLKLDLIDKLVILLQLRSIFAVRKQQKLLQRSAGDRLQYTCATSRGTTSTFNDVRNKVVPL